MSLRNIIKFRFIDWKKGYANRTIDYSQFLNLYAQYKEIMSEEEFADIIGITYSRYRNIKNRGGKTKILETEIDKKRIAIEVEEQYGSI